jgi:DNA polymerase III epsilon subunit family exonuclease
LIPRKESPLSELAFVSFDVETTGLDPTLESIIEVGAVKFDSGGVIDEYQCLVNPGRPIHPDAIAVHGITDEMVASGPPIPEILPDVLEFFGDSVLVAHNAPFDIGFFDAEFARAGVEPPKNTILCTLRLARAVFPNFQKYGLETLVRRLQIPSGGHHRASADAAHTAELFRRFLDPIGKGWDTTFGELLTYHGRPFRFAKARDSDKAGRPLAMIKAAIESGSSVRIEYRAGNGKMSARTISPISLNENGPNLKVVAFCHLRGENRTFRIDCIKKIDAASRR